MVTVKESIKQTRPFPNTASEAYFNIVLLAQDLLHRTSQVLRPYELSLPQYNALRILRGAGEEGRTCREIGERMVHRVPDVTRLLDRLEARGLITRQRSPLDRRMVRVSITPAGEDVLAPLDEPLAELHNTTLGAMGTEKLRSLIALLEEARDHSGKSD